jgi:hypothetical protein
MKHRILSVPNMLIERSPLQEELTTLSNETYACSNCGIVYEEYLTILKCRACGKDLYRLEQE